jgi:cytochrome c-type biogenesis protein CcmF
MIGMIGGGALQVALALSTVGAAMLWYAARTNRDILIRTGYNAVYASFGLVTIATIAMVTGLVTHDFSISYVAQVGSRETPLLITIISLWSALEGSILFWAFVLFGFAALAVWMQRKDEGRTLPYAAATLLAVGVFFLFLLVGPANPFEVVSPAPANGPGPNPLLQNHPLMAVHPPLLYLGYVGFTVPFAFAIGAMLSGEVNTDRWVRSTRAWTVASWTFLTAAIIAGMWWSYEVLGWGGYWAWDPVENASLMPWLTATAFLHSIMVQERRGMLRLWNLNLVIATFVLTVLGTFLTRSGVLSSVHAFTQGTIGYYFLAFIGVTLVGSIILVAGKATNTGADGRLDSALSRETAFLSSNMLFTVLTFTVLLGTLFPLVAEAVRGVKVSVGAPFFNRMTLPVIMSVLFLLGIGPALPWRRADAAEVKRKMRAPLVVLVSVAILSLILGERNPYAVAAYAFAAFALTTNLQEYWIGARARMRAHGESPLRALVLLMRGNRHRYGGYLAHVGVIMVAVGITASSASLTDAEATLAPGESMRVGAYEFRLEQVWGREAPHRFTVGTDLTVLKDGKVIGTMDPRQHFYNSSDQPVPTPSVITSVKQDLYANLTAFDAQGRSATLHILIEPLVMWIWAGGGVMCLGAAFGLWPARRRRPRVPVSAAPAQYAGDAEAVALEEEETDAGVVTVP